MGTNFVNDAPNVTPIKVTAAKATIDPINTVMGLFVLPVIMIAAICVLSPSSARKIDVKVPGENRLLYSGVAIFVLILIAIGGLYFYKGLMKRNISTMENSLNSAKERFEPAKIVQLQVLDKRLNASNEILSKHIAISPIFETFQSITLKNISYTKFNYGVDENNNGGIIIKMSGIAKGYESIALQSDIFAKVRITAYL